MLRIKFPDGTINSLRVRGEFVLQMSTGTYNNVLELLDEGEKINAIKLVRDRLHGAEVNSVMPLTQAKMVVEHIESNTRYFRNSLWHIVAKMRDGREVTIEHFVGTPSEANARVAKLTNDKNNPLQKHINLATVSIRRGPKVNV